MTGYFRGFEGGFNTLVLQTVIPGPHVYFVGKNDSYIAYDSEEYFFFKGIKNLIGSRKESDYVTLDNSNQEGEGEGESLRIDMLGGYSEESPDRIEFIRNEATQRRIVTTLRPHTVVTNTARKGSFIYIIPATDGEREFSLENTAYIELLTSEGEHLFQSYRKLSDIMEITITDNQELKQSTLRIVPAQLVDLTIIIKYETELHSRLGISFINDDTYFIPGKNKYSSHMKKKSFSPLEDAIEESINMANRFSIPVMTDLPASNEAILVAGFQKNTHILPSSSKADTTYLIAGNAEGNNYLIMPSARNQTVQVEVRRLTPPVPENINFWDRVEFDKVLLSFRIRYPELKRENFWLEGEETQDGLVIRLRADQNGPQPRLKIIGDQSSVLARVLFKTNMMEAEARAAWYTRLQVKLFDIPRKITSTCSSGGCDYVFHPLPLTFDGKKFININPGDVTKYNEIVLKKDMKDMRFYQKGNDLIVTDAIQPCVKSDYTNLKDISNQTTVRFRSYFENDVMQTLVLKFLDRSFPLKDCVERVLPWQPTLICHQENWKQKIFSDQVILKKTIETIATAHRNSNPLFVSEPGSLSVSSGSLSSSSSASVSAYLWGGAATVSALVSAFIVGYIGYRLRRRVGHQRGLSVQERIALIGITQTIPVAKAQERIETGVVLFSDQDFFKPEACHHAVSSRGPLVLCQNEQERLVSWPNTDGVQTGWYAVNLENTPINPLKDIKVVPNTDQTPSLYLYRLNNNSTQQLNSLKLNPMTLEKIYPYLPREQQEHWRSEWLSERYYRDVKQITLQMLWGDGILLHTGLGDAFQALGLKPDWSKRDDMHVLGRYLKSIRLGGDPTSLVAALFETVLLSLPVEKCYGQLLPVNSFHHGKQVARFGIDLLQFGMNWITIVSSLPPKILAYLFPNHPVIQLVSHGLQLAINFYLVENDLISCYLALSLFVLPHLPVLLECLLGIPVTKGMAKLNDIVPSVLSEDSDRVSASHAELARADKRVEQGKKRLGNVVSFFKQPMTTKEEKSHAANEEKVNRSEKSGEFKL